MPLDCQLGIVAMWGKWEGFVKWLMECCRVEVWSKTRCWLVLVLAGDWEKGLYKLGCDRERLKMIKVVGLVFEKCGIANLDVGFSRVEVKGLSLVPCGDTTLILRFMMPEDTNDHIGNKNAQSQGSVSTDRPIVSTDGSKVSTDEQVKGTEEPNEGTDENLEGTKEQNEETVEIFEGTEEQREGTKEKVESTDGQIKSTEDQTEEEIATQATQTPTSMIFRDDETNSKSNYLHHNKASSKIDPKDKGKKKIEEEDESESESDGIPQAEKKFKQLESDEELARKVQEEWEAEEERNIIAEENAANEDLIRL
ncbi:hypothetical protein Tco_1066294 [Tanacetum coccineum]|uniref:Uncharacterized protein n=1 Tax=Tanacetum coccineum TaxID=301880 RepID=A0ABQ5HBF9_9ASTR